VEGTDVAIKGRVGLLQGAGAHGTWLASGSEVTVRSGSARIWLDEGGTIDVCGPASFTALKSGGSLTLAISSGRVRVAVDNSLPVTIYSPFIVVTPLAIGGGPRETVVGLEAGGAMCVWAARGAVRLEHQFTSEALLVPQAGEFFLFDGLLEPLRQASRSCDCQATVPREQLRLAGRLVEVSAPASTQPEPEKTEKPRPAPPEKPSWTVVMPPLTFDASLPEPAAGPSPETILLVREIRVQPELVLEGCVESRRPQPSRGGRLQEVRHFGAAPQVKSGGLLGALKGFFARLFGRRKS